MLIRLLLLLASCIAFGAVAVADFDRAAYIEDSVEPGVVADRSFDKSKTLFFFLAAVNGQAVKNSVSESAGVRTSMWPEEPLAPFTRALPPRQMIVTLVGGYVTSSVAAPEVRYNYPMYRVKGHTLIQPVPEGSYVVKGVIREKGASIWIEETDTGKTLGDRITSTGRTRIDAFPN